MPRSVDRIVTASMNKYVDKLINSLTKIGEQSLDLTADDLYKEAYQIFDKCMDQFYEYKTRSYYRHDVGRGTGTGMNLYRASQFRINYGADRHVKSLHIGWNELDMHPYKPWRDGDGGIHRVDKKYVMENVMKGLRGFEEEYIGVGFTPTEDSEYSNNWNWSASVSTKKNYFGNLEGTPNEIFEIFEEKWDGVSRKLFREHFKTLYKSYVEEMKKKKKVGDK